MDYFPQRRRGTEIMSMMHRDEADWNHEGHEGGVVRR